MILAINTATIRNELTLISGSNSIPLAWPEKGREAEDLLPKIKSLLAEQKKRLHDLTGILAVTGPGSFSSLRVGVAAANALSYALNIPLRTLTTFALFDITIGADAILLSAGTDRVFLQQKSSSPTLLALSAAADILLKEKLTVAGDLTEEQISFFTAAGIVFPVAEKILSRLSYTTVAALPVIKIADVNYGQAAKISPSKHPLSFA